MKLATLLAAGAAAVICAAPLAAAPAAFAQDVGPDHGDWTLKQREDWLASRIDHARDDGSIDGREADRVRHELHRIKDDEDHFRDHHDGQLTDNETADLEARLDQLADHIQWLHENSFRRPW